MTTDLTTIQRELSPIAAQATNLAIIDDASLKEGVLMLSRLNQYNDSMQAEKEKVTKPLNEALRAERARFKPLETLYNDAIGTIRQKMTDYQTDLIRLQREAQEKIASKLASGYITPITAISKFENLPEIKKEISSESGLVQFAMVKKFEVVDMTMLPMKYHLPDEVAIRKEMKEGKEIDGVKYWTEQQPRNYR